MEGKYYFMQKSEENVWSSYGLGILQVWSSILREILRSRNQPDSDIKGQAVDKIQTKKYKKLRQVLRMSNNICIFAPDFTWSIARATSDAVLVEHYAMTYVSPQSKQPEAWFTPGTPRKGKSEK